MALHEIRDRRGQVVSLPLVPEQPLRGNVGVERVAEPQAELPPKPKRFPRVRDRIKRPFRRGWNMKAVRLFTRVADACLGINAQEPFVVRAHEQPVDCTLCREECATCNSHHVYVNPKWPPGKRWTALVHGL